MKKYLRGRLRDGRTICRRRDSGPITCSTAMPAILHRVVFLGLALCLPVMLYAWQQSAKSKDSTQLTKLADGVFAHIVSPDSDAVANAGVVVLDHSVLVFDTHYTPEAGQELSGLIRTVTSKPVRYVVNSHFHPDHTHGNQAFPGATVIGSAGERREMLQKDVPALNRSLGIAEAQLLKLRKNLGQPAAGQQHKSIQAQIDSRQEFLRRMSMLRITSPMLAFDHEVTIRDGNREVLLLYLGLGHSEGDIALYLPSEKIVFAGDLFFNAALPNTQDASMLEWAKTLEELLKLDADRFVPGHGEVGERKDVQDFLSYFNEIKHLVAPAVDRGETSDALIRSTTVPDRFSGFKFQNFFTANLQKMFVELKAQQSAPSPNDARKLPEQEKPNP